MLGVIMAKHTLEFVEVQEYALIDAVSKDVCLLFDSGDIEENNEKWEYVKTSMKSTDKDYRIAKFIPLTFVRE